MTTDSPIQAYTVTRAPTWRVPSRTRHGRDHVVTQVTDDGVLFCSCEAGQYGRSCWHREWVKDGRAGKPTMRIRPAAPKAAPQPQPTFRLLSAMTRMHGPAPFGPSINAAPLPQEVADDIAGLYSDGGAAVQRSVAALRAAVAS